MTETLDGGHKPTEEEMTMHERAKGIRMRDQISDGKYVVFKVEDFYEYSRKLWDLGWNHGPSEVEEVAEPLVVMDATVLRDQDILTAPALSSYADAALTVHDILAGHSPKHFLDSLLERAEFFRARALRAQQSIHRRLPD